MRSVRRSALLATVATALGLVPVVSGTAVAAAGDTTLVSAGARWNGTYADAASAPSVSADGRYVAFSSVFAWDDGAESSYRQVYVVDRTDGTATLVSTSGGGYDANDDSYDARVSADGRYVVYTSYATDLVNDGPQSPYHTPDVYRWDRLTGTTVRVSGAAGGGESDAGADEPAVSADGRYVAFRSASQNLTDPPSGGTSTRVYRRDLTTGELVVVDLAPGDDDTAYRTSGSPAISGDGRYVAFRYDSWDGGCPDDGGSCYTVYRRDVDTGTTALVSSDGSGAAATLTSTDPEISANGRVVAFETAAALVAGDTNGATDVYVKDLDLGTTRRASVADDGAESATGGHGAALSRDGATVAFVSASALAGEGAPGLPDIYVRHLLGDGETRLASVRSDGGAANAASEAPALDETAALVVFASRAANLAAGDTDARRDVFAHDLGTGVRTRLTVEEPYGGWAGSWTPVRATLTAQGAAFGYAEIDFVLRDAGGTEVARTGGVTDGAGRVDAWIQLPPTPGDYLLDATFEGGGTYAPAAHRVAYPVRVRATTLEYTGPANGVRSISTEVSATLRTADGGHPMEWYTVRFELRDGDRVVSFVHGTTDATGRASGWLHVPPDVETGQYAVVAAFEGEVGYGASTVTAPFAVGLWPTTLTSGGPAVAYRGEPFDARARLVRTDTGEPVEYHTVRFTVERDGEPVTTVHATTDAQGWAVAGLNLMSEPGEYVLRLDYEGAPAFAAAALTAPLDLRVHPTAVTYLGDTTAYAGESAWLRATVTDLDRAEPVSAHLRYALIQDGVTVGDGWVWSSWDGSAAEATIPSPPAGEYTLRVTFEGDLVRAPSSVDVPFTVRHHPTRITAYGPSEAYTGTSLTYVVALDDPETGAHPGGGEVEVVLRDAQGAEAARQRGWLGPDGSGDVTLPLPGVVAGTYDLAVEFAGDARFAQATWDTPVVVRVRPATVDYRGDTVGRAGDFAQVRAYVTSPDSDPSVAWHPVRFTLHDAAGAEVAASTGYVEPDGHVASHLALPATPGAYTVRATLDGGALFEHASADAAFQVVLDAAALTYHGPANAPRGTVAEVGARLTDPADGDAPLAGRPLTFELRDGNAVLKSTTATTGPDGLATAALDLDVPGGEYLVAVRFAGDGRYAAAQAGQAFTVRVDATALTYAGATSGVRTEGAAVVARLVNTFTGDALAGRTVTATLRSGADVVETATLVTDASGWVAGDLALDVPAGDYTLVLSYAGATAERPASVSVPFAVTLRPVTLTYGGAVAGVTGHDATLAARLVRADTGAALAGRTVTFALDGATATGTTDADGVAHAVVRLPAPGTYDVTASSAAGGAFAAGSASATVTVARAPAALAYTGGTGVVSGEPVTLSATLTRADSGSALGGRAVTFSVVGDDDRVALLTGTTAADGSAGATWTADVPAGTYTVEVAFDGDALATDAATSAPLVVTRRATAVTDASPASGVRGTYASLAATVTDAATGAPVAGRAVTFALGSLTATGETDATGRATAQLRLDLAPGTYDLVVTSAVDGRRAAGTVTRAFTVRWQHSFTDDTGQGTVHLNVTTKEFQFAGRTETSAIVHDPAMTVTYGVGGSIVEINYSSPAITLVGTFQLATGRFNATVTTPRGYYVLKRV